MPLILFVGLPGNGKTTPLEELVKALNIPSLTVDAAGDMDIGDMDIGDMDIIGLSSYS